MKNWKRKVRKIERGIQWRKQGKKKKEGKMKENLNEQSKKRNERKI